MPLFLEGKVALVTGGARGLGAAIVRRLAAQGATGSAVDRELATADALPQGFAAITGDVTDEASIKSAIEATVARFGRLDIVVANAGIVPPWYSGMGEDHGSHGFSHGFEFHHEANHGGHHFGFFG